MRTLLSRTALSAVAGLVVLAPGLPAAAEVAEPPTDQNGGSIVEDHAYPGAADILAHDQIKLISGDGHIQYADCATPPVDNVGVLKVWTTEEIGPDGAGLACFKVTGAKGWLNLQVPAVYEIRGDGQRTGAGHQVTAEVTTDDGDHTTVAVNPSGSTQVGIGADPANEPTTLLRLTVDGPAGGGAAAGVYPFAAKVDVAEARSCSGALVAPQWIITSAACFAENGQPAVAGPPAQATTVTLGSAPAATVTTIVPHADRDVVLAKLKARVSGVDPVRVGTTAPATGDVLQAAGFGRTATVWAPDQVHQAAFTVGAVGSGTLDLAGADAAALICKGDAGGPLLRETDAGPELVAVHHAAWQANCLGSTETRQGAVDTRVDDLAGWIAQTTAYPTQNIRVFYEYASARTRLFTFAGSPVAVAQNWDSGAGNWDAARGKNVTGDFDGDGMPDTAMFYNYDHAQTKLWLFLHPEPTVLPRLAWDGGLNNWDWTRAMYTVGDFDGDGKDEIGAFYNYGNNQLKLWVFDNIDGTVTPRLAWDSGVGNWDAARVKLVAGDVNGDGKAEIGAFYNYDGARTRLWLFTDVATTAVPHMIWDSNAGNYDWNRSKFLAGDFDGDGKAEFGGFYNYGNSQTKLWLWDNLDGTVSTPMKWDSGVGHWDWNLAKVVAADVDGDGITEIGAFYNYGNLQTKLWIWDGIEGQLVTRMVWDSGAGNWDWARIRPASGLS